MKFMQKLIYIVIVTAMLSLVYMAAFAASKHQKPQPPLQISIAPAQPGVTPENIRPGDVVDFKVTATSMVDTTEMRIEVKLTDGAELVSGELSWSGPAMKNEMKTLPITIKVPLKGIGSVKAQLSITVSGGSAFTKSSEYALGGVKKPKTESERPVRKDSRGRGVVEYR